MKKDFESFDLSSFWEDSEYSMRAYVDALPSDEEIKKIESELGYKLPDSYIELMRNKNGGIPVNTRFPCQVRTSWAKDHIAIDGFLNIGRTKTFSLCGEGGSQFMIDSWWYPDIGIYFATCPSAGHDMIALDYRKCSRDGIPQVVHVDQEYEYQISFLAENFETFAMGLTVRDDFD
ncbi:SMI1/KNR4 family protein [Vibrio hippocampi]|uniref:Knr4/Smi1-like domain-containing protein n=1 Tax=Vibrio hippocampi TaxID=654686 RepID=A0ABM8ZGM9_9VIBR|nr:SMI1/KNR4 family protein [Vibrio hippocampi]CAH0525783.1 hypothetical protein VHP8226_01314 [Vibrio hippocampi]